MKNPRLIGLAGLVALLAIYFAVPGRSPGKLLPYPPDDPVLRARVHTACGSLELSLLLLLKSRDISAAQSQFVAMAPLVMLCTEGAVQLGMVDGETYPSLEDLQARIRFVQSKIAEFKKE